MRFNIDWAGAYQAWQQSGLSRRCFQYSPDFQAFLVDGQMPSEDTVRTRFRSIRDRLQANYVPTVPSVPTEQSDEVEVSCNDPVQIMHLSESDLEGLVETTKKKAKTRQRLRHVIVHLADGRKVEFETRNPELFALKALCCNVERL